MTSVRVFCGKCLHWVPGERACHYCMNNQHNLLCSCLGWGAGISEIFWSSGQTQIKKRDGFSPGCSAVATSSIPNLENWCSWSWNLLRCDTILLFIVSGELEPVGKKRFPDVQEIRQEESGVGVSVGGRKAKTTNEKVLVPCSACKVSFFALSHPFSGDSQFCNKNTVCHWLGPPVAVLTTHWELMQTIRSLATSLNHQVESFARSHKNRRSQQDAGNVHFCSRSSSSCVGDPPHPQPGVLFTFILGTFFSPVRSDSMRKLVFVWESHASLLVVTCLSSWFTLLWSNDISSTTITRHLHAPDTCTFCPRHWPKKISDTKSRQQQICEKKRWMRPHLSCEEVRQARTRVEDADTMCVV